MAVGACLLGALDAKGGLREWLYRLLYFELPRGHAKSTVAAMEATTVATMERDWRVYIGAGAGQPGVFLVRLF